MNKKKNSVIKILSSISEECPKASEKDHYVKLRERIESTFKMADAVLDHKIGLADSTLLSEKVEEESKPKVEEVIVTQKLGQNNMISFKNKFNENSLRSSSSSFKSTTSKVMKVPKNFDLHDDVKLSHLHVNQTAKKVAISKNFKSKNAALFDFKPKINEDNEDLRNKFIDLIEMPNKVIDEMKYPEGKKSFVKSKIYDALNYVKEKKMQLKSKR